MSGENSHAADRPNFWDRIAHTPLRDAIRRDWKYGPTVVRILREAGLPKRIADVVHEVIREARLWRSEQLDVARELAAHFRDGLDAGRSEDELIENFGDPAQTARLIRITKKRSRPLWWRTSRRTMHGLGLLLAVSAAAYLVLAVRFFTGSPTITRDYLAEFNRPALAVPEDERAWPVYRSALTALEEMPAEIANATPKPGDEHWELYAQYVQRNAAALDIARQAAAMPGLGFVAQRPIDDRDAEILSGREGADAPLFAIPLPHLSEMRRLARLLNAEARITLMGTDAQQFVANIEAVLGIATHLREHAIIINDLVAFAIFAEGLVTVGEALEHQPELLSDRQLIELAHQIASALGGGELHLRLEAEALIFEDLLQRTYTDDGRGGGRITPSGVRMWQTLGVDSTDEPVPEFARVAAAPAAGALIANRRAVRAKYDQLLHEAIAEAREPLWQRTDVSTRQWNELEEHTLLGVNRFEPIKLALPLVSHSATTAARTAQRRDGILIAIALELYRREHGNWPVSLDELTPRFLPAVPVDRFDGRPMRYAVRDDRAIVYSVGTNREDNGGVPPRNAPPQYAAQGWSQERLDRAREAESRMRSADRSAVPDGDWILWPLPK